MNFVAPAGSNVAYIGLIITGVDFEPCLSYHTIYEKEQTNFHYHHDLDKKISADDIKIYFNRMKEIIPLNWYTKFILRPATEFDKASGIEWMKIQSDSWKEKYGSKWMTRASLRWMYNLELQNLGLGGLNEKEHFDGTCLYNSYEVSQRQFAKFGTTYYKKQHEQWLHSQKSVVNTWNKIIQCDSIARLNSLNDDFFRGIALGHLSIKSSLTEESAWQQYIK
jgi:hypothetical protein